MSVNVTVQSNPITITVQDQAPVTLSVSAVGSPGIVQPAGQDKQVQFNDGGSIGADSNFRWNKNTKGMEIGVASDVQFPNNPIRATGEVGDYLQMVIQNNLLDPAASADIVATNDIGTDDTGYIDMGINSSIYSVVDDATGPGDGYVDINGGNLFLITETPGTEIPILVGGTTDSERVATFTETGLVMEAGKTITDRPPVYYGTGSPPSATGLIEGSLFFKYT